MRSVASLLVLAALVVPGAQAMGQDARVAEGLYAAAAADGVVRVIVQVQASDAEALAAAGVAARGLCANEACAKLQIRSAISAEKAPVVEDLGDSQLLMEVTEVGLRALDASPFVTRVVADALTPVPPEPTPGARPGRPPGLDEPL